LPPNPLTAKRVPDKLKWFGDSAFRFVVHPAHSWQLSSSMTPEQACIGPALENIARPLEWTLGGSMYAVIRTGGKQYRVAPGDVVKIEKAAADENGSLEFSEVLSVSGNAGSVTQPAKAKVVGTVLGEGRGDKILVFHYKRKKQYKKLQGHRQSFTQVRIDSIQVDGKTYGAK
jgi:large subunit ribosomal protein L21